MPKLTTPETRAGRAHHTRDAADCPACGGWGAIMLSGGANLGKPTWGLCQECQRDKEAIMETVACQCEHIGHLHRGGLTAREAGNPMTPNGNPGHHYGARYVPNYMQAVSTAYGQFTVCRDCAGDCYHPDQLTKDNLRATRLMGLVRAEGLNAR